MKREGIGQTNILGERGRYGGNGEKWEPGRPCWGWGNITGGRGVSSGTVSVGFHLRCARKLLFSQEFRYFL